MVGLAERESEGIGNLRETMKANSQSSMRGVFEKCEFTEVKKIADIGGGYGHLVIALLEKYPHLNGVVADLPELIPVAKVKNPAPDRVAGRLEYVNLGQERESNRTQQRNEN